MRYSLSRLGYRGIATTTVFVSFVDLSKYVINASMDGHTASGGFLLEVMILIVSLAMLIIGFIIKLTFTEPNP
ncbi:hypothetical protein [Vulcanisaeta souniana]|uniref:hypothetical protein n=1 Tax=Vulcanisaeta souniana TaxID=164452 RepID=UPI001FB4A9C5|nr:hypothetical protein [Vulcanisaeta souniana]